MASIEDDGRASPAGSGSSGKAKTHAVTEAIRFNEAAKESGFLIAENSTLINVYPSRSTQMLPESKIKIRNLVDYNWDVTYSTGRMLSTHLSGRYIAYVVRISNTGGIRIVDIQTQDRVLIKGSKGFIRDVEFMHKLDDLIVGFIDEYGTTYIYKIVKDPDSGLMQTLLILEVSQPGGERTDCRRFIWCKFIPDDATQPLTPKDGSYHFAVVQDDKVVATRQRVYVANLCQLIENFGEGRHCWPDFKRSYMEIDVHTDAVLDASFAPDGTALATASRDGTVKFFQVYLIGSETALPARCLYSWAPHNGRPVTSLFFLDDHSANSYDLDKQYWKYLITAGPNMSELKLWTCKEWECLQTIKFCCPSPSQLKIDLNITAKFLVISDIHRKCMFVLSFVTDQDPARFEWISEFSLPCCMISFNINNARIMTLRQIEAAGFEEYVANETETSPNGQYCILDISYVQPKSLQQGTVAFPPPKVTCELNAQTSGRISFDTSVSYIEGKADDLSDSPPNSSEEDQANNEPVLSESSIKTPPSQANMNPLHLERSSPTSPHPSTSMLSQQLSSLLLTSSGSLFSNGVPKLIQSAERANSLPPTTFDGLGILTSPTASGSQNANVHDDNIQVISRESPSRLRTSSKNSNSSRASSSPSREVEEILSPKTTEQQHPHKNDVIQSMDEVLAVNNFDLEGNVLQDDFNSNYHTKPLSPNVAAYDVTPQMPQVLEQVSSIMEMMQAQAQEMRELKRELTRLNSAQLTNARQLDEGGMARILDKYFSQNSLQVQRLEDSISALQFDKQREPTAPVLPPNFGEVLANNIGKLVKGQMESMVLPSILTLFEPVRTQVQAELVKMVMNAESRIKQELKQAIQSPEFKNSVAADLEVNMKSTCENIIPRVLLTSIVPNFEKSLQSLYVKVNETFLKGTKEYIGGLEGTLESRRSIEVASQEELKDQLSSMQDNISSVLQVELESQMMRVLSNLQSTLVRQLEETVSRELNRAFKEQQRYLETSIVARAATPALSVSDHTVVASPPVDPEAVMKQMIKLAEKGDIAGAFVQASHYADITYMIRLAERINPNLVFTSKLPPQTHVAIIQHMAADLMTHTEVKFSYLSVAISTLNTADKKILKSVARIVPVFQTAVRKFADSAPTSPHLQGLRILEMAFVGMCSSLGSSSSMLS